MSRKGIRIGFVLNAVVLVAGIVVALTDVIEDDSSSDTKLSTMNVATAAQATIGQSARLAYSMEMVGLSGLPEAVSVTGHGAFDGSVMEMTMDMSSVLSSIEASTGEKAPPEIAERFVPTRTVIDKSIVYMCGPSISMRYGVDAECGQFDYAQFDPELGNLFDQQPLVHHGRALGPLLGAHEVEDLGGEEVRGVATHQVRGTYLTRKVMEQASPEMQEDMQRLYEQLGLPPDLVDRLLDLELPFEAWIDDQGLVRRSSHSFDVSFFALMGDDVPDAFSHEDARITMTTEFFDFDQPIEIQIPTDAADLMEVLAES